MRMLTYGTAALALASFGAAASTGGSRIGLPKAAGSNTSTVLVYGATGGGFGAAVAAGRSLKGNGTVVLLAQRQHIGGMVTGGLQHTDVGNASVIGGLTLEFFTRVEQQYPGRPVSPDYPKKRTGPTGWLFESHVAERVMLEMLAEAGVQIVRGVGFVTRAAMHGTRTVGLQTDGGGWYYADFIIDASYEGDAAAAAGASTVWGREAASQYNEQGAGRQLGTAPLGVQVSPYVNGSSGPVIPHVSPLVPAAPGGGDLWVETYTFRTCMTNSPKHRVPLQQPDGYNPADWELWRRIYAKRPPRSLAEAGMNCLGPIPNNYSASDPACASGSCKKCDMIGSTTNPGTDMVGASWAYPNASAEERRALWTAHGRYVLGVMWFWGTDPAVPATVRDEMQSYGLCDDEYGDVTEPMPHWPHQLYVREARRLVGDWVYTEAAAPASLAARSIGMGSYSFDCHQVSRVIHRDASAPYVVDEGRVNLPHPGVSQPAFAIPYDAMLPARAEVTNMLVPVAMSASHVRFNALRMEPTWMIAGHAAGDAAALAARTGSAVQDVDVLGALRPQLRREGQLLDPSELGA